MGKMMRQRLKKLLLALALLEGCQSSESMSLSNSQSVSPSSQPSVITSVASERPAPVFASLADFTRGLCQAMSDFIPDPAWDEKRAQAAFGPWREGEQQIAAGEMQFVYLPSTWNQPYFSFNASPGVRIRHMGRFALPSECMGVEALSRQPIGTYDKPWQYLVIEADQAGSYRLVRESGPPLEPPRPDALPSAAPSWPAFWSPTISPDPDRDVVYDDEHGLVFTTLNGYVFDEDGHPVENAHVQVNSLKSEPFYEGETLTDFRGFYQLRRVLVGHQLLLRVNKPGFAERRRVELLIVNLEQTVNRISFGVGPEEPTVPWPDDFHGAFVEDALSDLPEVVSVQPGRFASAVLADSPFSLKFSEPVDPGSVEANFGIWAATDELLSVGKTIEGVGGLIPRVFAGEPAPDLRREASLIWDASDFDIVWNQAQTEASFNFKPGRRLPSDREKPNVPDYLLALSGVGDNLIKDRSGNACDAAKRGCFKLVSSFERWVRFAIQADSAAPEILDMTAQDGGSDGDRMVLDYSEPMLLNTRSGPIAGGSGTLFGDTHTRDYGLPAQSPLNPDNYELSVLPLGTSDPALASDFVPLSRLGVKVEVEAAFGRWKLSFTLPARTFGPGDRLVLRIRDTVTDPAGNPVAPGQQVQTVTVPD